MRKDIKKSSYYVWFLGAQEAKGLRGAEYVLPVVRSLVEREREVEPFKVTLQVSHKGLKIVQNVPGAAGVPSKTSAKPGLKPAKAETVKHLIPHHAVTCVLQQEDIVACILLLYNPVTKCPVHVHAYRCDSVETAQILCGQLQTLIERPDNQKKLAEIEARLRAKGLLLPLQPAPRSEPRRHGGGSDGRSTSTRESESSGGSSSERLSGQERVTNLYDSLAAELREKLGADQDQGHAPILLPPRDYDTVHRQKGNLASVDRRRCLSAAVVGVNAKNVKNALEEQPATAAASGRAPAKRGSSGTQTGRAGGGQGLVGSSGGSSGIGSDHAPSPDNESDPRYLDNASSSDEEWNEPSEDSLFLVQPGLAGLGGRGVLSGWRGSHGAAELSLPRARRVHSPAASPSPSSPSTPATPGSLTRTDPRDHPLAGGAPGSRRRHTSPTPPTDRHAPREDEDLPSRTRVRRPPADERQRARSPRTPRSPRSSPRSPRSPRAARSPPRSLSPGTHHRAAATTPVASAAPRRGAAGSHPLSGPMSPRERFQDAKEKFLSLERERLEEQERVMQLNMEKRRSSQQPQPAAQSPHSPPIVEPPISPAMVAGPRPRPRPRRPSWSRSREDSDDEMLDAPLSPALGPALGPAGPGRYYADEDEDDVDFSGNAPPMGGRQRIIAAVNRRMSRESLEDDADDFTTPPARTTASSRPGPPRHEYPAAYRGDRPDRAEHPGRGGDSRSDPRGSDPRGGDPRGADHRGGDPRGGDHRGGDPRGGEHRSSDPRAGDHRGGDPRGVDPRGVDPRGVDPRAVDPRGGDPRGGDPRGADPRGGDPRGSDPRGGDLRGIAAVSRSRSVHREDRFRSPARGSYPYPSDAMTPMAEDGPHPRYRIPYNEDLDIPLERYRSSNAIPHAQHAPHAQRPPAARHPAPYPRDHDDDLGERERAYLADKKRRSVFEVLEDERRRHSNELAQEFKRRSYQELDERDRYPGLDRETARDTPPGPPGHPGHGGHPPPRGQVSARYRHSYAEPPPRHHDLLHRANSAASPRVGIAAVRPY